jgi:DNA polymerase-3 subunit beta
MIPVSSNWKKKSGAAADSFRLATRRTLLSEYDDAIDPLLIPARTLVELARILPTEGNVEMIVTPNRSQVLFRTENIALVSRLIEGSFPNFHQLIPGEYTTRAVIETEELAAAIKTVIPFARDSSNITILKIARDENAEPGTGTLTLEATAEEIGSNVSTVNAFVDGPPQQVIFNVKYLSDILAVLPTPEVALEITSSSRPGVLKSVGAFDCTYVIMPMHINR